ncbi:membrane hypothetical protein [Gammaproteobacteria bacterium]
MNINNTIKKIIVSIFLIILFSFPPYVLLNPRYEIDVMLYYQLSQLYYIAGALVLIFLVVSKKQSSLFHVKQKLLAALFILIMLLFGSYLNIGGLQFRKYVAIHAAWTCAEINKLLVEYISKSSIPQKELVSKFDGIENTEISKLFPALSLQSSEPFNTYTVSIGISSDNVIITCIVSSTNYGKKIYTSSVPITIEEFNQGWEQEDNHYFNVSSYFGEPTVGGGSCKLDGTVNTTVNYSARMTSKLF